MPRTRASSMNPKPIAILILVALCVGSGAGKWQSAGVPSRRDAGLPLESQGPHSMPRDSRAEGAPEVPVREKLRPCCAFGMELAIDFSFISVPVFRISKSLRPIFVARLDDRTAPSCRG